MLGLVHCGHVSGARASRRQISLTRLLWHEPFPFLTVKQKATSGYHLAARGHRHFVFVRILDQLGGRGGSPRRS
jgi:hypothetical protein